MHFMAKRNGAHPAVGAPHFLFHQIFRYLQQKNRHQYQDPNDQNGGPQHQFREMQPASVAGLKFFFEVDHGERNPFIDKFIFNIYTVEFTVGK